MKGEVFRASQEKSSFRGPWKCVKIYPVFFIFIRLCDNARIQNYRDVSSFYLRSDRLGKSRKFLIIFFIKPVSNVFLMFIPWWKNNIIDKNYQVDFYYIQTDTILVHP